MWYGTYIVRFHLVVDFSKKFWPRFVHVLTPFWLRFLTTFWLRFICDYLPLRFYQMTTFAYQLQQMFHLLIVNFGIICLSFAYRFDHVCPRLPIGVTTIAYHFPTVPIIGISLLSSLYYYVFSSHIALSCLFVLFYIITYFYIAFFTIHNHLVL